MNEGKTSPANGDNNIIARENAVQIGNATSSNGNNTGMFSLDSTNTIFSSLGQSNTISQTNEGKVGNVPVNNLIQQLQHRLQSSMQQLPMQQPLLQQHQPQQFQPFQQQGCPQQTPVLWPDFQRRFLQQQFSHQAQQQNDFNLQCFLQEHQRLQQQLALMCQQQQHIQLPQRMIHDQSRQALLWSNNMPQPSSTRMTAGEPFPINSVFRRQRTESSEAMAVVGVPRQPQKKPKAEQVSKYKGVTWHKRDKKWMARVWIPKLGRVLYLGTFFLEDDAAKAIFQKQQEMNGSAADNTNSSSTSTPAATAANAKSEEHSDDKKQAKSKEHSDDKKRTRTESVSETESKAESNTVSLPVSPPAVAVVDDAGDTRCVRSLITPDIEPEQEEPMAGGNRTSKRIGQPSCNQIECDKQNKKQKTLWSNTVDVSAKANKEDNNPKSISPTLSREDPEDDDHVVEA